MNNIAVCLCSDNNYVPYLGATISSILKNKDDDEFINIYIIDGGIEDDNKIKLNFFEENYSCKITYVTPNLKKLKNCHTFSGDYISLATYYRLLIPELIKSEDRILYFDCDIIVRNSLNGLYKKDFGDNLILAVEDIAASVHSKRLRVEKYINAGVMLMNLKQMRKEKSTELIFEWIKNNQDKIECHDQDVINASLQNRIEYIENKYNAQVRRSKSSKFDDIKNPLILHFISPQKPWTLYKPLNYTTWGVEFFTALENTPWEDFIRDYNRKKWLYLIPNKLYPTGEYKAVLRKIFSIKNTSDKKYKILTVCNIEFKYLRKKKISDNMS